MKELLLVFIGGGTGSILRFASSKWFNPVFDNFFLGTFLANLISCVLLGFLSYLITEKANMTSVRPFLMVGLCGGFSTFSTFTLEMMEQMKQGQYFSAMFYVISSLVVCALGLGLGIYLSKAIVS